MLGALVFSHASRAILTRHDLQRFPADSLFDRIARVLCEAECLPRKELFESWELARRTRRRFRGGRIVDLACGHGLVAHLMLLLDDTSEVAIAADARLPASAPQVAEALVRAWPRLGQRVELRSARIQDVALAPADVVVAAHACGALTDEIITRAIDARARLAVLPCCHDKARGDAGGLEGWLDPALAIDATRAARLRAHGYRVYTQTISREISPKNRLLLAEPLQG
ncbi:MAG: methyltransferase [Polyangiaceae bacterium]|nr:methyltransferase [Polyangiaceae bacterium]